MALLFFGIAVCNHATAQLIGTGASMPMPSGPMMPSGPPSMPPQSVQMFNPNTYSINVAFSQGLSSNWGYGDQNYLAIRFAAQIYDQRAPEFVKLRSSLQFALGATYSDNGASGDGTGTSGDAIRVGDNNFFAEEVVLYPLGWMVDPYIAGSLQTPVTESFAVDYVTKALVRRASLWDPVTAQYGTGFNYTLTQPSGMLNMRVGLGRRITRAHFNTQLTDDWKTPTVVETYKEESGVDFNAMAMFRSDSTISYTGRLALFGTFEDLSVWTVTWNNTTEFKLWKSLGLIWKVDIIHDIRQTRRTQFMHTIMLGMIQNF
ncbi:MAG: hypothetical protein JST22_02045 [Bacteroidetes bacterium]|nr:hypothetical protein [Bacteroidota bacterium]